MLDIELGSLGLGHFGGVARSLLGCFKRFCVSRALIKHISVHLPPQHTVVFSGIRKSDVTANIKSKLSACSNVRGVLANSSVLRVEFKLNPKALQCYST